MPTTVAHAISYPSGSAAPNVPLAMQSTAESVAAAITAESSKIRHAEYSSALVTTTSGSARFIGALTVEAAKTFNNTFVQPDVSGKLKIKESGVYAVHFLAMPIGQASNNNIQINVNGTPVASITGGTYGSSNISVGTSNFYFNVNDILDFTILISAAQSVGGRVTISKLHG